MLNSTPNTEEPDKAKAEVEAIVRSGPRGALVLAGIATALVVAIWLAFYLFVFTPRASL
jgi:hypothetical protein